MSQPGYPDINAGSWYLQARADCWDVCEPTTGETFARVRVDPLTGEASADGEEAAAAAGLAAVQRFLLQFVAQPGQGLGQ